MNSGEYDYGANVEIGYFDQMQQNLDLSKTALDEVWDTFPNMTQTEVRSALRHSCSKVTKCLNRFQK